MINLKPHKNILNQNYFQNNDKYFQPPPPKSIAMGSTISSIIAEIYLQLDKKIYMCIYWYANKH